MLYIRATACIHTRTNTYTHIVSLYTSLIIDIIYSLPEHNVNYVCYKAKNWFICKARALALIRKYICKCLACFDRGKFVQNVCMYKD